MKPNSERIWQINLALVIVIITTIPYLAGYLSETAEWKFSGFLFGVEDGNSYIAKMLNGAYGEWLFRTPYTAFNQQGIIAFFPFILLGKIASQPGIHDQLVSLYQIFRWLSIFVFVFASYDLAAFFLEKQWQRKIAVVTICLGGGLGWLYFTGLKTLWGSDLPLDFYSPETFGYLELFGLPHLAMARALLFWGLLLLIRNPEKSWSRREYVIAAAIWFGIGFFQPLHIVIGWILGAVVLVWGIFGNFRLNKKIPLNNNSFIKEQMRRYLWVVLFSVPWVLYNGFIFVWDPFAAIWMKQNILASPPWTYYLLAYGWLLPAVLVGITGTFREKGKPAPLLVSWAILIPVLAYFPINVQRRLVEGVWAALVILAIIGFNRLFPDQKRGLVFYISPVFFSGITFFSGMLMTAIRPQSPAFLQKSEVECYKEFSEMIYANQVVLASKETSNSLPAWVNARTIVGHGPESTGNARLEPAVSKFFGGLMTERELIAFVEDEKIEYVFLAKNDMRISREILNATPEMKLLIDRNNCQVFSRMEKSNQDE